MTEQSQAAHRFPESPLALMVRMYRQILPDVRQLLDGWRRVAEAIPDSELRTQALASIATKTFHCQGGAAYATVLADRVQSRELIAWIVAFQTISDYLDNLCDRSTSLDAEDFRALHMAMLDAVAVDFEQPLHDYYAYRTEKDDGHYLRDLVLACRRISARLPSFTAVAQPMRELVQLYCDLQVYKHIRSDLREAALGRWWDEHCRRYPDLHWQEFAAATGSTLGVFYLLTLAARANVSEMEARRAQAEYFPAICGLHILLDYLIDMEEDKQGGDLNFCTYYESAAQMHERMVFMVESAQKAAERLPQASFHRFIVEGLLALYLSDEKVGRQPELRHIRRALMKSGTFTRKFFYFNSLLVRRIFK